MEIKILAALALQLNPMLLFLESPNCGNSYVVTYFPPLAEYRNPPRSFQFVSWIHPPHASHARRKFRGLTYTAFRLPLGKTQPSLKKIPHSF